MDYTNNTMKARPPTLQSKLDTITMQVLYMLKITPGCLFPSVTSGLGIYLSQGVNLRQAFISLTQSVFLLEHTYF